MFASFGEQDRGEIQASELGTLFAQINALTAAEGLIASSVTFSYPRILRVMLYAVFVLWLGLLSLTEIGPTVGYYSLLFVGLLSLSSIGLYSLSNRYANPFRIKSEDSTQTPLISIACKETELAIDGIFARHNSLTTTSRPTQSMLVF